jgi:hypothetical protein
MFILELGPVAGAKTTNKIDRTQIHSDGDDHTSTSLTDERDSFEVLDDPGTPYQELSNLPNPQRRVAPPAPNGTQETPGEQVSRRLTGCDELSCELRDSVTEHLASNPNVTNSTGRIRLATQSELFGDTGSSNTVSDILDSGVQKGLIGQEEANELLEEFAKLREERRAESQELEMVLGICAASGFPDVALASLKSIVGFLRSEAAISAANGAIGQFASWAMDEARKLAKEKGDPSYARNLISILEGYSHGPHIAGAEHGGAQEGAEHVDTQVYTHVEAREEPVYAVDENNNILGIAYYQYTYEEVPEVHEQAHAETANTIAGLQIEVANNEAIAEQEASARRAELQRGYAARENIVRLHYTMADNDPEREARIDENQKLERKYLGTA